MIGKTNAVVGGGGSAVPMEKVNVTLTSNQSSAEDLLGATITLSYGEYSEDFVWDGKTLTFSIMQYVVYTLSFSSVSGYKTPSSLELVAVADNVRQIDAQYQTEVVTVTVSAESGASVSGQKVTINGVTTTLTTTGVVSQKIPYGTPYSVSANDKSGYDAPVTKTFTASQPARSVSMVYEEIKLGVFIQDTTGKLWTSDAWDGSATPNGVAVRTDVCGFVIALSQKNNLPASSVGYKVAGLPDYTEENAINDYSGLSNTSTLLSAYGADTTLCVGYCKNFTFPNGKNGYLGSMGEWWTVNDNKSAIETCISKAGGTAFGTGNYFWSSTQAGMWNNKHRLWCWDYTDSDMTATYINSSGNKTYARPFTTLR